MIIVTGCKRSGTSMWMQILEAAGFPPIGDAFPRDWGDVSLREANREGFYESSFRNGIHPGTNPIPGTEHYVPPQGTERMAVKVFPSGFVRTHRAFIDRVVVTVRPWRAYVASRARLFELDAASQRERGNPAVERSHLPAALEWWMESVTLMRDLEMRRFLARWVTYDAVLADPVARVGEVVEWLGGEVAPATKVVQQSMQTQDGEDAPDELPDGMAEVCDAWCQALAEGRSKTYAGVDRALQERIVEQNRRMQPVLKRALEKQHEDHAKRRKSP